MTQTPRRRAADGKGGAVSELPVDRLREGAQDLLSAMGERALGKVGDAAGRLTDYAQNGGTGGLVGALTGDGPKGRPAVGTMAKAGLKQATGKVTGKVKDAVGGLGPGDGGDGDQKVGAVNIVESVDVGVPVTLAYNMWTQFEDFPGFMSKVEKVEQTSETELDWKARIFLSRRKWQSTVDEQIPDERIIWHSTADKGHVDGAVTFHEVTPDLTKIILLLQYHPQGFFERTGNLWRAQGRRARLELKHFQRHVTTEALLHPDEVRGWRGEVQGGEVVRSDEEVREDEEAAAEEAEGEDRYDDEPADENEEDEAEEDDGADDGGTQSATEKRTKTRRR